MSSIWKPNVTVAAVIEQYGKFLLVEEETDDGLRFNQPAGHLECREALVDAVVRDLAERGYAALPIPLSGAAVGAPHKRARVFVVARHVDGEGQPVVPIHAEVGGPPSSAADLDRDDLRDEPGWGSGARGASAQEPERISWRLPEPDMVRVVHGVPRGLDRARTRALGNSVIPQCAQVIGHVIRELTT